MPGAQFSLCPRKYRGYGRPMARALLVVCMLLASCEGTDAKSEMQWKSSYTPAECKALVSDEAVIARCGHGDISRAAVLLSEDATKCLPFSAPEKIDGIWFTAFELSNFYEGAKTLSDLPSGDLTQNSTWFSSTPSATRKLPELHFESEAFRLEIMGRRSLCRGAYGHLGYASKEVIATDVLNVTPLRRKEIPTAQP